MILLLFVLAYSCAKVKKDDNDVVSFDISATSPTVTEPDTSTFSASSTETAPSAENTDSSFLTSADDIDLHATDDSGAYFAFVYNGEEFTALYFPDNWRIYDSYKIKDEDDIILICQALKDIYPIHSADYQSYRTAEDMAYEWLQHNIAYNILPDSSSWKESAKDVDIDPKDQGKSVYQMFLDRN